MIVTAFEKGDREALKPLVSPEVLEGFSSAIAARRAEPREDVISHMVAEGHSDREIVEKALGMAGVDAPVDPLLELRKRRYRELVAHDNPIAADTVALVGVLADHGVPMAIVTGCAPSSRRQTSGARLTR